MDTVYDTVHDHWADIGRIWFRRKWMPSKAFLASWYEWWRSFGLEMIIEAGMMLNKNGKIGIKDLSPITTTATTEFIKTNVNETPNRAPKDIAVSAVAWLSTTASGKFLAFFFKIRCKVTFVVRLDMVMPPLKMTFPNLEWDVSSSFSTENEVISIFNVCIVTIIKTANEIAIALNVLWICSSLKSKK